MTATQDVRETRPDRPAERTQAPVFVPRADVRETDDAKGSAGYTHAPSRCKCTSDRVIEFSASRGCLDMSPPRMRTWPSSSCTAT